MFDTLEYTPLSWDLALAVVLMFTTPCGAVFVGGHGLALDQLHHWSRGGRGARAGETGPSFNFNWASMLICIVYIEMKANIMNGHCRRSNVVFGISIIP